LTTPLTAQELLLIGAKPGSTLPSGGLDLIGTLYSGSGSASSWTSLFNPFFAPRFGLTFINGSLNLRLDAPIEWDDPHHFEIGGRTWEFCPLILAEVAIGLAFRGNRDRVDLLEVASPVFLRERLGGASDGTRVPLRLLAGTFLRPAA
jgi:hypothetical protein